MKRAGYTLLIAGVVAMGITVQSCVADAMPSPKVHAFYYPWYGNPETDGHWVHWDYAAEVREGPPQPHIPPEQIGANFYPAIGLYSSNSPQDLATQMRQLRQAGIGVIASSWWGQGDYSDKAVPQLLDAAAAQGIQVCFHLEPFAGRDHPKAAPYRDAIVYLIDTYGSHPAFYRYEGKPLFYVYDSYLVADSEWASIFAPGGANTIRGTAHDAVCIGQFVKNGDGQSMLAGHFDGFYTYFATDGFTHGSTLANWPAMAKFAREHGLLFIPSVGPGYDDTRIRPWNGVNRRGREDGAYYDREWQAALDVQPAIVSITSWNEWHEGTQIEPAVPKTTLEYTYLDYAPNSPE
ncbi:MAG: glycoprotein endo-alpha,2-mannosidase, partial [Candidatus Hydrogenedentes bacterium]|nr:glycoprotein endo-alpha,2-mannosidase [Candidatus Hydrogenedentota bacterium]